MPRMIANAKMSPYDPGNAFQRPEFGIVALRPRALEQDGLELAQLAICQLGHPSRAADSTQPIAALALPDAEPTAAALPTDAQPPGYLGLRLSSGEASARGEPPPLFRRIVRATKRNPFHRRGISSIGSFVTSFCEAQ